MVIHYNIHYIAASHKPIPKRRNRMPRPQTQIQPVPLTGFTLATALDGVSSSSSSSSVDASAASASSSSVDVSVADVLDSEESSSGFPLEYKTLSVKEQTIALNNLARVYMIQYTLNMNLRRINLPDIGGAVWREIVLGEDSGNSLAAVRQAKKQVKMLLRGASTSMIEYIAEGKGMKLDHLQRHATHVRTMDELVKKVVKYMNWIFYFTEYCKL